MHELLNAQDTVLCSYFAQRMGTKNDGWGQKGNGEEIFQEWKDLNDNWGKAVEGSMDRKVEVNRASKQVDVERLKRNVRAGGWQPEPSMEAAGGAGRQ